jgi:hypothetical protein
MRAACVPKTIPPSYFACRRPRFSTAPAQGGGRAVRTSWSKPLLADFFVAAIPFDLAAKNCGAGGFIALDNTRSIEFLLYLSRSWLLPPGEAFECHQNLTMVHQTAALHVNEGKGNQSRLIDDISRGGGPNLVSPWITVCVISVWAIWCRHLEVQSVGLGHVSIFVSQDGKGKGRRVFVQGTRIERFDCDNDQRRT